MTVDMSQFYEVFFDEAAELLAEKERLLLNIDVSAPDTEDLNAVFRTAHSIKGGASTFGFTDMTEMTHVLESLLDRIRKNEITLTAEHVDAFLAAKDVLTMLIEGHRHGAAIDHDQVKTVSDRLNRLSELGNAVASAPAVAAPVAAPVVDLTLELPLAEGMHRYHVNLPATSQRDIDTLTTELALMGEVTHATLGDGGSQFTLVTENSADDIFAVCSFVVDIDTLKITEASAAPAAAAVVDETPASADGDDEIKVEIEPMIEAATPVAAHAADAAPIPQRRESDKAATNSNAESSSIRVSIEKVDQLINLVGELVITQAMIDQRIAVLDPMVYENLLNSVNQLARNTRDLQESVMSIRMMPMDYVFSRFPRMVRDLAAKLGKKIDFITQGAATELDKGLIERIVDPLNHLVRNSVDHGIETPEVRREAGKSETGKLTLAASHQGGNIVIEVRDDGAGLNRERILKKAEQQGIPVSDNMPDDEVWQLIFAPGFSTAEVVTDVSGRGVGMDVVKRNIAAMGGTVDIRSTRGNGSTMRISLPLTLAILDGMSVKVGEEVYIVPLAYVIESLQPETVALKEVAGQGRLIKVREEYLPLIYLHEQFSIDTHCNSPEDGIVVILLVDGKKAALLVDGLVGQQQVVVKNLESNFRKVPGISGATILGDGGVSLILDVGALMRSLG
ncbi:chemotaxis protein CheA [Sulfuriferula nivalis]|uniref:Chemotaxis protein CheA n=1 Tax=Sulfuriferula nivalis TaxID=2675298 RepID=A0A809RI90_9PROT|nr:chemotaxis protein CheA [Sulfuriferula nivalis]BBP01235.1 chemotaxis protein CheA [Sulfuriferula nivalis]BBP02138.1 chemotaxis protein CheA [Sulfuriferula nivalis]